MLSIGGDEGEIYFKIFLAKLLLIFKRLSFYSFPYQFSANGQGHPVLLHSL